MVFSGSDLRGLPFGCLFRLVLLELMVLDSDVTVALQKLCLLVSDCFALAGLHAMASAATIGCFLSSSLGS